MVVINSMDRLYLISAVFSLTASSIMILKNHLVVNYDAKEMVVDLIINFLFIFSIIIQQTNVTELKPIKLTSAYWRTNILSYSNVIAWIYVVILHRFARGNPIISESNVYPYIFMGAGVLMCIVSVCTLMVLLLFPIPTHRKVTGKYTHIGTKSFNIAVDKEHHLYGEFHSNSCKEDQSEQYLIPVQVWFPIVQPYGRHKNKHKIKSENNSKTFRILHKYCMMWTSGVDADEEQELLLLIHQLCDNNHMSQYKWLFHHLLLSVTQSEYQENFANIDTQYNTHPNKKLPIALYSHGMHGWRQCHSSQCEDMASHGYMVFALDHSPCSTMARPVHALQFSQAFDYHIPSSIDNALSEEGKQFYVDGVNRRVTDMRILIDYLSLTKDQMLHSGLSVKSGNGSMEAASGNAIQSLVDIDHVHVWGHSYGGISAACLARRDTRVQSAVVLDGWFFPIPEDLMEEQKFEKSNKRESRNKKNGKTLVTPKCAEERATHKPHILMLSSHEWDISRVRVPEKELVLSRNFHNMGLNLILKGSAHQNMCDMCYLASSAVMKFIPNSLGSGVDSDHTIEFISYMCIGYFNMISAHKNQAPLCEVESAPHVGCYHRYIERHNTSNDISIIEKAALDCIIHELISYCQLTYRFDMQYLVEILNFAKAHVFDIHDIFKDVSSGEIATNKSEDDCDIDSEGIQTIEEDTEETRQKRQQAHDMIREIEYFIAFFVFVYVAYLINVYFIVTAKKEELSNIQNGL